MEKMAEEYVGIIMTLHFIHKFGLVMLVSFSKRMELPGSVLLLI